MAQSNILFKDKPPSHCPKGQGLLRVQDERDHRMPRELVRRAVNVDYKYWVAGDLQNQHDTPHCVEYMTRGLLEASPARNQSEGYPRGSIYSWCQDNDEWPGADYDGTSVHAAMKWLHRRGYISGYQWATSVEEVHAHLMLRGPIALGTTWYEEMSYVDEYNFARVGGQNWGGHAYFIRGRNRLKVDPRTGKRGVSKLRNSWGFDYAEKGEAWIADADLQILIEDYGEVALFVEKKLYGVN